MNIKCHEDKNCDCCLLKEILHQACNSNINLVKYFVVWFVLFEDKTYFHGYAIFRNEHNILIETYANYMLKRIFTIVHVLIHSKMVLYGLNIKLLAEANKLL